MSIQIVVESMFGNSREVAEVVADGAREAGADVSVTPVAEAGRDVQPAATLLVVGGPTHAFSMTRSATRADALREGAPYGDKETGIREWIDRATPRPDLPVITFDTRIQVKFVPGSAAKSAAASLKGHGFAHVTRGPTFFVLAKEG
ncbi:MAG: hypothetical protein R2734_21375, partial [Nocardioides sp.]